MREGHGTRGPRGMDTMGEAGERGQKKAVRYPCSAIVGPVAAGGPPGETHRGRLRGPPGGEQVYLRDPRARRADARPPPLGGWVLRSIRGVVCAGLGGRRSSAAQGAAARMARGQRAVRRAGTCAAKGAVGRPMRGAGRRLWGPWPTLGP
ncbi:unnamed protein product [Prorocentrum cordatum]|uniref:Uncharacterized protein n=1 Tax=Prorocentrum cordatum TaxID=2364126 RepID=A0ABN9YCX2_9DINO|nr:unnamed protein product [Polarella glacialis]